VNWQSKRVLVTGAGSFIGRHLTECLVELSADVHAPMHYNALGTLIAFPYSYQAPASYVCADIVST
jgi:nucleoside-diphosphate-sugar epimerase